MIAGTSIDKAFTKQFEAEVHQAYQRMGSKLRNTVRTKNGVRGSSTIFQRSARASPRPRPATARSR